MRGNLEPGWVCPACGLTRGDDLCDPCLGHLPGVKGACCHHGDENALGYIKFENGTRIYFKLHSVFQSSTGMIV
jgi:hypothetical protein